MGHISRVRLLVGTLLVGSVALAQQGLIVEPWRQNAKPAPAQVLPSPPVAEPGLAAAAARLAPSTPKPAARVEVAPASATPVKWTPPVVELTVDPWAKQQAADHAARPRWVPQTIEIIDPWGGTAPAPRVAVAPTGSERSTIF